MAETLLLTIKERINQFSNTQKKIATYILNHAELIPNMTTKELANKSGVSEASVNRFSKTIGIESFKTFKITLAQEQAGSEEYITDYTTVQKTESPYDEAHQVIKHNKSS